MASPAWAVRRRWWLAEYQRRTGSSPVCAVCGRNDGLELHHHEYLRLGREAYADLIGLCAACHQAVHNIYDVSRPWRTLGRRAASIGIISAMQRARSSAGTG